MNFIARIIQERKKSKTIKRQDALMLLAKEGSYLYHYLEGGTVTTFSEIGENTFIIDEQWEVNPNTVTIQGRGGIRERVVIDGLSFLNSLLDKGLLQSNGMAFHPTRQIWSLKREGR